jgi:hypothetical protein
MNVRNIKKNAGLAYLISEFLRAAYRKLHTSKIETILIPVRKKLDPVNPP